MNLVPMVLLLLPASVAPREPLASKVIPREVGVGAFYNGANVKVEGAAAPGSRVIVTITGSDREERFNRKARFGPIWITAGRVRVSGVPALFLRFSAEPVAAMLGRDAIAQYGLDEVSLKARMHIETASPGHHGDDAIRSDYLALKKAEGIYSFGDKGVIMEESPDCASFALDFRWPKKAPPGAYEVRVYEVRDGSLIREASFPFSVVRTGFPAWIAELAETRASLYGVAAVLIAALAGFGIDFITTRVFGKKRRAAH